METRAYIGLGSNLDDPAAQLRRARAALADLPETRLVAVSSVYRSRPLYEAGKGTPDQPDFCNAVAALDTRLTAEALLAALLRIEDRQGRTRAQRWGPRTLDLDLLLYGDEQRRSPRLMLPHPGLTQRAFVLYPLHEIAPGLEIPGHGALGECLKRCPADGLERQTQPL